MRGKVLIPGRSGDFVLSRSQLSFMSRMQERTKESQGNHFPEALSDY